MTMISIQNLRRVFGDGAARVAALDGVDLELRAGEYVAIQGTSGSGKSTLLQILGLLDTFDGGSYRYRGRAVEQLSQREVARVRNEEIGFVFQAFHLLSDHTALENVALPLLYRRGGAAPHEPRAMLERVGLGARIAHRPGALSAGECQRVAIARALVKRPHLILFDEPTGNLDSRTGAGILALLDEIHGAEHATLVLVTHDANVAARADRVLELSDGKWVT